MSTGWCGMEGLRQMSWGGVSPHAAPQTWPHAAQAFSLCLCASLSPAPADAAPRETTPADSKNEDASGHANVSQLREWQQVMINETTGN